MSIPTTQVTAGNRLLVVIREGLGIRSSEWSDCTSVVDVILGTNSSVLFSSVVLAGGGVILLQVVAQPAGRGVVVAGRSVEHCWG